MGNVIKVLVRDPEAVNLDKICRLALEMQFVRQVPLDAIEVVSDGPHGPNDFDIEGDEIDRDYGKRNGRSMTELYAIRIGLAVADAAGVVCVGSPVLGLEGLAALCQSLAENHGKVSDVKGGFLYKEGMVTSYAQNLSLLPERASEIVGRLVKAVAASLGDADPISAIIGGNTDGWDEIDDALAAAGRALYVKSRDVARALQQGTCANGWTFRLAQASGSSAPEGVAVETDNSMLAKHFWAAVKTMKPAFNVATAIFRHVKTDRIAVLCSNEYPVDIRRVVKELRKRFPETEFNVNEKRNTVVWDPRSKTPGPTVEQMQEIVSAHLAFKKDERSAPTPGLGATIGDAFRQQVRKRR